MCGIEGENRNQNPAIKQPAVLLNSLSLEPIEAAFSAQRAF